MSLESEGEPAIAALAARHLLAQRKALAALAGIVKDSIGRDVGRVRRSLPELPGPELRAQVRSPSERLIRDYLRHVGGDVKANAGRIPAHLFPHWALPLAAQSTLGLPYRLVRAVNGGCRLTLHRPLLAGLPLTVRARLLGVKDNGRRAVLQQRVVTGQAGSDKALEAELYVIVPSANETDRRTRREPQSSDRPRVAGNARELGRFKLSANAGLAFALLTGDLNPVHWLRPYARAAGFDGTILHGFATLARVFEALQRTLFGGSTDRLQVIDVRFTSPLYLPAEVGLYLCGDEFSVGSGPGQLAHLTGSFRERPGG
jgi:acyl dehydratase